MRIIPTVITAAFVSALSFTRDQPKSILFLKESSRLQHIFHYEIEQFLRPMNASFIDDLLCVVPSSEQTSYASLTGIRAILDECLTTEITSTPAQLIQTISTLNLQVEDWIIETEVVGLWRSNDKEYSRDKRVSSRMLMCAIAQKIQGQPALYQYNSENLSKNKLFKLVETKSGFFFGTNFNENMKFDSDCIINLWKKRPYTFSAALSLELSDSVVNILLTKYKNTFIEPVFHQENVIFYDPCCGSGTTLYSALRRGLHHVYGSDINPQSIQGVLQNFDYCGFDKNNYKLQICDAANDILSDLRGKVDILFANLPWGENKFEYFSENDKIIANVGLLIHSNSQVAFIHQKEIDNNIFEKAGLHVVDVIPIDQGAESNKKQAGRCWVTFCNRIEQSNLIDIQS